MPDKQNYARLGDVIFSVSDGISGFSSDTGYDYAQHDLATGKPTLQAMGETLSQVAIDIQLRHFLGHDVPAVIDELDAIRAGGEPQMLVFASGIFQGNYVIKSISSKILRTNRYGSVTEADLTINLTEYADRESQSKRKIELRPASEKLKRNVIIEY
jgi:phage protein U